MTRALPQARAFDQLGALPGDLGQPQPVGIADDRHQQPMLGYQRQCQMFAVVQSGASPAMTIATAAAGGAGRVRRAELDQQVGNGQMDALTGLPAWQQLVAQGHQCAAIDFGNVQVEMRGAG